MNNATKKEILARIANQPIGDVFHIGRIRIERIGELDMLIGDGYADMPVSDFIVAIKHDKFFAGYPLHIEDWYAAKWDHQFTMPDLLWANS